MAKTLMAVDAGTGSVRAVLFSLEGEQLGCVQQEWTHREDPRYPGSMDFDWVHNWDLARGCIRRVIEQTTKKKLPEDFQRAEFLLEHGFCDAIVERRNMKKTLAFLLRAHSDTDKNDSEKAKED